jgi:FtsP/CotA-like multicopper oxidase with cupredoxin domain
MSRPWRILFICTLLYFGAEKSLRGEAQSWESTIRPSIAEDINPDPSIVEVELTAAPIKWDFGTGGLVDAWAYNGSIPGPTIEAFEDDRVIVHFKNRLPVPSTVYWYGVETPATMAGSSVSQIQVEPDEDFRYEFRVPRAATYFYRAGINPSTASEMGLYGAIVVEDPGTDLRLNLPEQGHILVLDDVPIAAGQIMTTPPSPPTQRAESFINGREGNHFLVNGLASAIGTIDFTLPHRMHLINAANARFMNLEFEGAHVWRIGSDAGLLTSPLEIIPPNLATSGTDHHHEIDESEPLSLETLVSDPFPASRLLLTPGERADLIVVPDGATEITLRWHDFQRGLQTAHLQPDGGISLSHDHDKDGQRLSETILRLLPMKRAVPIRLTIGERISWPRFPSGYQLEYTESLDMSWRPLADTPDIIGNRFGFPVSEFSFPHAFFRLRKSGLQRLHDGGVNYRPPNGLVNVQRIVPNGARTIKVIYTHSKPEADGDISMAAVGEPPNSIPFHSLTSEIAPTVQPHQQIVWEVHNLTAQDRNFHLNGFPFQLIESEFHDSDLSSKPIQIPAAFIENQDTILIPKRPGKAGQSRTIVRVISELDDWRREGQIEAVGISPSTSRSGGWIYGTSMLEAADRGMQGILQIR